LRDIWDGFIASSARFGLALREPKRAEARYSMGAPFAFARADFRAILRYSLTDLIGSCTFGADGYHGMGMHDLQAMCGLLLGIRERSASLSRDVTLLLLEKVTVENQNSLREITKVKAQGGLSLHLYRGKCC
jgi:hypothetical protein